MPIEEQAEEDPERRPDHHHRRREAHAQNPQGRGHGAAPFRHEAHQDRRARRGRGRQEQDRQRRDVRETIAEEEGLRPAPAATRPTRPCARYSTASRPPASTTTSNAPTKASFILHFAGKDEDHVRHAVQTQVFKNMGLDVTDEDFAVEQTEQQERTTERVPKRARTPGTGDARRTGREAHADAAHRLGLRGPGGHGDGREQPRRPASRTLMGQAHGRHDMERAGRPRLRGPGSFGKAAADPSLRDKLDTILRDDYGQGAQTQEQTRRQTIEPNREKPAPEPESEPKPAPDEARTLATRQQTQARADNPRPAGKERKPKPIRSKKALLRQPVQDPAPTSTSPNRRTTCHPPRTGTARPAGR